MVFQSYSPLDQAIINQFKSDLQRLSMDDRIPDDYKEQLVKLDQSFQFIEKGLNNLEAQSNFLVDLADTSQLINSTLQIDEILNQVMDTIIRITGAERCFLALNDPAGNPDIRIARNWEKENLESQEIQFSRTIIQRVQQSCQPIVTTNAQMDERFAEQKSVMMYQLRSILCLPFNAKGKCIGVIYADNRIRSGIFSPGMLDTLIPFANQAAVAIENARLFQQIEHSLAEVKSLKQMMDNIFASIPSGVLTTDQALRVTMYNKSAQMILGKKSIELSSLPITEIMDIPATQVEGIRSVQDLQKSITGLEIMVKNQILGDRDIYLSISPLKDENQKIIGTALVLDDYTEQKRLEASHALFQRMVSPAVITQLQGKSIEVGGERKIISVLFADVRGFTSYCEHHSPEELISVLNQYLGAAANTILEEGGTIDKFLGDAVMAWFNAPLAQENHRIRAIRSALAIQAVTHRLNKTIPQADQLSFGIGLHTGEAVLGLVGAQKRMDYTAIGDCVNTARRIQEHANGDQILLSQEMLDGLADVLSVEPMPDFQAKGKNDPLAVYELRGLSPYGSTTLGFGLGPEKIQ